ncbi:N-acetylmuramic acid 6-phosphate etherase [Mesotoga sp. H07.pep.5.3]|uniref:N-acetylmuramic acid 6-phosphate etherase n=1 Tax=Mesotoga sp. H07.pep.5.3 TaxID=1421003 RepID=UPI00211DEF3F|nr:N-acetylmuramic acid 6-phosphate etherase [Mesotoga sp. H07.pep.5.3]
MKDNLEDLPTESVNRLTETIDIVTTEEKLRIINYEDKKIAHLIEEEIPTISRVIEFTVSSLRRGGRVIYVGAGTSGRIGVIDASEVHPTFGEKDAFVAQIAGGREAFTSSVEGAEDSREKGCSDILSLEISDKDTVIGITASGRTPYVIAALECASKIGAKTVCISNVKMAAARKVVNVSIEVETGPEVIVGSTRMKAGTAQKMVVNMISTVTMIEMGKVFKNLMVDLVASNEKLVNRSIRIVELATGVFHEEARKVYELSGRDTKVAILMILDGIGKEEAKNKLQRNNGILSRILESNGFSQ